MKAKTPNLEPAKSQNETYRRALVLAIAPRLIPGPATAVVRPAEIAQAAVAIVDRILEELERKEKRG